MIPINNVKQKVVDLRRGYTPRCIEDAHLLTLLLRRGNFFFFLFFLGGARLAPSDARPAPAPRSPPKKSPKPSEEMRLTQTKDIHLNSLQKEIVMAIQSKGPTALLFWGRSFARASPPPDGQRPSSHACARLLPLPQNAAH
jgi:hypothetical protein